MFLTNNKRTASNFNIMCSGTYKFRQSYIYHSRKVPVLNESKEPVGSFTFISYYATVFPYGNIQKEQYWKFKKEVPNFNKQPTPSP